MARLDLGYEYVSICHTTNYYSSREVPGLTGVDGKFNYMTEWFSDYYFNDVCANILKI